MIPSYESEMWRDKIKGYESEMWETLKNRVINFYLDSKKEEYSTVLDEMNKIEVEYVIKGREAIGYR